MPDPAFDADFADRLTDAARRVETRIEALLAAPPPADGEAAPERLAAAMRHALLSGGKRFRPFLVMECAALFGVEPRQAEIAAASVECLHTYSLVHDDLPAMDDDDLRRGAPTVHKAFDEATAILAGDALLTFAFELLASPAAHPDGGVRAEMALLLARASGAAGMAGGQMLDLSAEHRRLDEAAIGRLQAMKTGALIAASCEIGAVLGGAGAHERRALAAYGRALGKAFQIADDLLDVGASPSDLGKAAAKDAGRGKATFVALLGRDGAAALLADTVAACAVELAPFGARAKTLTAAARFAAARRS